MDEIVYTEEEDRYYLNVPFSEKEVAKKEGAKWDSIRKQWYTQGFFIDSEKFAEWMDFKPAYTLFSQKFYLVQASRKCWKCNLPAVVYAVACKTHEYIDGDTDETTGSKKIHAAPWKSNDEETYFPLSYLSEDTLKDLASINHPVVQKCIPISRRKNSQQYCNHCSAKQGNFYLFEEIDSPFSSRYSKNDVVFYEIADVFFRGK